MADTFTPKKGVTYYNKSGPNQGVTAGPVRTSTPKNTQQATYYAPQHYSAPSGGGGAPAAAPQGPQIWDDNVRNAGPTQDDLMREIDSLYGGSMDYLNQAENAVRADYPNAMAEAESLFNTNRSTLGNQKDAAFTNLDTQKTKATGSYENALADARRLYQEQQVGAQQRFGGSSSAGQAVSEIQAREQARQFGQTNRQYTDLTNQIETQRNTVEKEFQTGLLQLEQQKQSAISNATRDFQNKLLQISNNRAQIGQAKAEARLGALQQLRSEVFAIEQQNRQFSQTLEAQRQSALLSLGNFNTSSQGAVGQSAGMVNNYNPNASLDSSTAATGGLGQRQGQQMTGMISRDPNDPYNLGFA